MTNGVQATVSEDRFESIFKSRDSGADTAAPDAGQPVGKPRDEQGRFAPKQPEAPVEPAPAQPDAQAQADQQPAPQTEEAPRMVPLSETLNERKKRKEAEARAAEYQRKYEQALEMAAQNRAPQQAPQQPEHLPDPLSDPQGFAAHQQQQAFIQQRNQIANLSEDWAVDKYGQETVQKALQWVSQDPRLADHFFLNSKNPYREMVETYKQRSLVAERSDPSYEAKIRADERAKVAAELKKGNPLPQFPGTLASATPAGVQGAVRETAASMAKEIFGTDRKR